ncbi:seryl-tRNA synthetase [Blastocystis sp. subtype 4]|uniref:seryl-tRNA synthetase n=1 Tax=Blastocystis sp. subtype 4 TaxID=944170 RepID=UPI00071207FC|nr:seryl-tRNA synthetase [Blastocystis sp. subtype 4]XP_014525897.1 seryl-tRNA synthetase [Blastocystis sp. subtype 4]KNB41697.1 seryl-tRNA synthetase [Blastocystis sp. subtype 4]KNB42454.1 seryl-tRNA synthetase [Blastocystis sp. subtype 4]|eukprot:XP_014525140.1 seryl-tRNA synthetase [Blastocystis sp. subtype 4]
MPIDINLLRVSRGGNPDLVRQSQRNRYASVELVDEVIELDDKWRAMTGSIDNLKKEKRQLSTLVSVGLYDLME